MERSSASSVWNRCDSCRCIVFRNGDSLYESNMVYRSYCSYNGGYWVWGRFCSQWYVVLSLPFAWNSMERVSLNRFSTFVCNKKRQDSELTIIIIPFGWVWPDLRAAVTIALKHIGQNYNSNYLKWTACVMFVAPGPALRDLKLSYVLFNWLSSLIFYLFKFWLEYNRLVDQI